MLVVAGFMTFWAKCNTRTFHGGAEAAADGRRPRSNGTAQGPSMSHDVLLKRLSSLEDVVYRQLNGKKQLFKVRSCADEQRKLQVSKVSTDILTLQHLASSVKEMIWWETE